MWIYILIYLAIGFIPSQWLANKITDDFEKNNPPGTYRVRFKLMDGLVYRTVYGLSFMFALILGPLTWTDYLIYKLKKEKRK
jgi:hypothetical protein